MVLEFDLNDPPPVEDIILMGSPMSLNPNLGQAGEAGPSNVMGNPMSLNTNLGQAGEAGPSNVMGNPMSLNPNSGQAGGAGPSDVMGNPVSLNFNLGQAGEAGPSNVQARTDSEPIDDEVVICSPRSFAVARDKARRNRVVIEVLDEETEFRRGFSEVPIRLSPRSKRRRRIPSKTPTTVIGDLCINLGQNVARSPELPVVESQPKASTSRTFSCPICLGPFVEETSTKCGHIFCKDCIKTAITAQKKCPTCRRKLKVKDTFRIYLPTTD